MNLTLSDTRAASSMAFCFRWSNSLSVNTLRFVISSVCRPAYILCLHGSERCRPLSCRVLEHALPLASVCPKPGAPSLLDQHSHTLCARAGNGSADGSSNGFIVSNTVLTFGRSCLYAGIGSADGSSNDSIYPTPYCCWVYVRAVAQLMAAPRVTFYPTPYCCWMLVPMQAVAQQMAARTTLFYPKGACCMAWT